MKAKKKNIIFICQFTESILKIIKCKFINKSKREFAGLETEVISTEKLIQVFKKLGYDYNPIRISLPRNKVTSRLLKLPTQIPKEIENIISLQASRYLPYPSNELVTGYQILSTDKEGYSEINLIIVPKDVIKHYIDTFKDLKTKEITISLSSYGLVNLYNYVKPGETGVVMVIDIDYQQIELAIISSGKLLFSRYFKIDKSAPNWESLFINEINRTKDVYLKEVSKEAPHKIILTGSKKIYPEFTELLNKQVDLPVEDLSYLKINISGGLLDKILISEHSFASMIGLGLKEIEENLDLLPQDIREKIRIETQRKKQLQLVLFIVGMILILGLGIAKNLDNKAKYLKQLTIELSKIANEAQPLEKIETRLKIMQGHAAKKFSSLDLIYELHQTIPNQISLVTFSYEEDNQVILRGQAPELNSVFAFVNQLEKSATFKNFNIKVRYATKKKTQTSEIVDFEIVCVKK